MLSANFVKVKEWSLLEYKCIVCGKEMSDYEPQYCCDGKMCGCLGRPVEPPVCSEKCWNELMGNEREWFDLKYCLITVDN